jgi:hypothetical protein
MRSVLILAALLLAISSRALDTNKIISISLPVNLEYSGVGGGSRYETNAEPMNLSARWTAAGKSGRSVMFLANIAKYPYRRMDWTYTQLPSHAEVQWHPLQPITGRVRLVSSSASYTPDGEPLMETLHYEWMQ